MLSEDQLLALMRDLESDRVERTEATNKSSEFAIAVCPFSNDMPNHRRPGFLLIGVQDNGLSSGLRADDKLLLNLASRRQEYAALARSLAARMGVPSP